MRRADILICPLRKKHVRRRNCRDAPEPADRNRAHPEDPSALALLQEGTLHLSHERGTSSRTLLPQTVVFALDV
jgi:hypothetical protein